MEPEVTKEQIGQVINSLVREADTELLALQENGLDQYWYFRWDPQGSIEWNVYQFSDLLELYKRKCRRWEEHHHGSCCVVERVRDKYVMPKVKAFLVELQSRSNPVQ